MATWFIILLLVGQCLAAMDPVDMEEFFKHTGASGTQHGKTRDDPDYYKSNSGIPHLPTITGLMGTHGTIRFLTIHEQTAVLIGDGKHGVWRVQENGLIREYRKKGKEGLPPNVDPNNLGNDSEERIKYTPIIEDNYAAYIPEESWGGYKYPDQKISDGQADNITGHLNFIDLSIYHPKYNGKYNNHPPIDLPNFYCTMTSNNYANMRNTWKYAVAQPLANKMGPLAIRAGMDIKENFHNVLRFDFIGDAGVWANVGIQEETDYIVRNLDELNARYQTINYQRIDFSKVDVEAYLYERPFFNVPYVFITFVMDTKKGRPSDYSYVRPHGPYWDDLTKKFPSVLNNFTTDVNHYPPAYVENYPVQGKPSKQSAYGLPVYGQHHPARFEHGLSGGACPNRGGDWARYPWGNSGAGFPTNYEEVTPICDAFVLDMKMWMNLQETWNKVDLFLGNAGYDGKVTINYTADANIYGNYTDKYLIERNAQNPFSMDLTNNHTIVGPKDKKPPLVAFRLNFTRRGRYLRFTNVTLEAPPKEKATKTTNNGDRIVNNFSLFLLTLLMINFVR